MRDTTSILAQRDQAHPAAELAESRLRGSAYLALKNVTCDYSDGVLTLGGRLPSYHLKQMAQALVLGIEGVQRVENLIEVMTPAPRAGP